MTITFVTDGAWGTGTGIPHNAAAADQIIYELLQRIVTLEAGAPEPRSITGFSVVGNQLTVVMSDATNEGPFTLPISSFIFLDSFTDATLFKANSIFPENDALWLVTQDHVTETPFDPGRTIVGDVYRKVFGAPAIVPNDLHMFIPGVLANSQLILYTEATRRWQLPASLTGSRFRSQIAAAAAAVVTLKKNGSDIGTLSWALGGFIPTVAFVSSVTFNVSDTFTVNGPATADLTLADISFDFLGNRI